MKTLRKAEYVSLSVSDQSRMPNMIQGAKKLIKATIANVAINCFFVFFDVSNGVGPIPLSDGFSVHQSSFSTQANLILN